MDLTVKRPFRRRVFSAVVDGLFPSRCAGCERFWQPPRSMAGVLGELAEHLSNGRPPISHPSIEGPAHEANWPSIAFRAMGPWFCPECREGLRWVTSPFCTCCGRLFASRAGRNHLCGACSRKSPPFEQARACGIYEGSLKNVIQRYKYSGQVRWADPLGLLLYLSARHTGMVEACDAIVPVPLHPSRLRERGFNQALLLLRRWSQFRANLTPGKKLPPIMPEVLIRRRPTIPQTGLPLKERSANLKGAFELADTQRFLAGKKVLLIDDVFTTGATVTACVRVLKAQGRAAGVSVLTLAETA